MLNPTEIPEEVARTLIVIGAGRELDDVELPPVLQDRDAGWRTIMCGHDPWERLAWTLDRGELRSLCRGLVTYFNWMDIRGGSVSPVIILHRQYVLRFPEDEAELTAWIVEHRNNDYEPFGTTLHGDARSVGAFREYRHEREERAARNRRIELARQEHAAEQRRIRRAAQATVELRSAVRAGNLVRVQKLFELGAHWPSVVHREGSLVDAAEAGGHVELANWLRTKGVG